MSLIDSFIEYLKSERNKSERTQVLYRTALEDFKAFYEGLNEGLGWESMTSDVVREWVVYLLDGKHQSNATVNLNLSALRTFYHYLKLVGVVTHNPMQRVVGPKKSKVLPVFVKEKDMDRLLDEAEFPDTYKGVLDRTIIQTFYLTGMRRAELLGLEDRDVDFVNRQIKVTGKRNKQRVIPFGDELEAALKEYLTKRNETFPEGAGKLFVSSRGKALAPSVVTKIVKDNLSRVTSVKKRSPHVLRHSFATVMLNNKADLVSIQKLLGHANLHTTEVYTHVSFEELKDAYKNAHPRS